MACLAISGGWRMPTCPHLLTAAPALPLPCCLPPAVNERRDHIPPVVSGSAVTFPFDIQVAG